MITRHAQSRSQQRAVPHSLIECLKDFGRETPARRGCVIRRLDRKEIRFLRSELDEATYRRLRDKLARTYAVIHGNNVITVGIRLRRVYK